MATRGINEESFINSIVGPGTFFRGHVELHGLLRIDGDFSGSVRTDGRVIVGKSGRADCAIEAGTVVIGGLFRGEILAYEKVVLLSSCVALGSVAAPRLIVEEGVLFSGRCRITGSAESLVASADNGKRKKSLLLETVRRREESAAARNATEPAAISDEVGAERREPTPAGAAPERD
ncbi:MAG: polymer-forming cytoskeletal protein [Spirochaetales bacterium]|nr:polymer-forming cytoskeletal protein [Spirochaetales bacterium]